MKNIYSVNKKSPEGEHALGTAGGLPALLLLLSPGEVRAPQGVATPESIGSPQGIAAPEAVRSPERVRSPEGVGSPECVAAVHRRSAPALQIPSDPHTAESPRSTTYSRPMMDHLKDTRHPSRTSGRRMAVPLATMLFCSAACRSTYPAPTVKTSY